MTSKTLSSLSGPGWMPRRNKSPISMGVLNEYSSLASVTLTDPESLGPYNDPQRMLFDRQPNFTKMAAQFVQLKRAFEEQGVTVSILDAKKYQAHNCPNIIFQRDTYCRSPIGYIRARMAAEQRAEEEAIISSFFKDSGLEFEFAMPTPALFEGADILWMNPKTALIANGARTNKIAIKILAALFKPYEVTTIEIPLSRNVQHLLGVVNFIDEDLAAVRLNEAPDVLLDTLARNRIYTVPFNECPEVSTGKAMNFVTVRPRQILAPSAADKFRSVLTGYGVDVLELDISEYCAAAGGIGCATGIVKREL